MAYGQDGSSGAAAIVSGIALLLQHSYQLIQGNNTLPPASLVKAILINSADDLGNEGPDYASGYGNTNAANAVLTMLNNRFFTGTVQQNETTTWPLNIGPGISKLKATLCWTDPPADPGKSFADTNGVLEYSTDSQTWQLIAQVEPEKRCYRWMAPDINSLVRLRMTVGSHIIQSDEFIISSRITGFTGFNCTDSFLIGWNRIPAVPQYSVFTLRDGDQYLRPLIPITTATQAFFKKSEQPSLLYAIAPVIGGMTGQKSFTFDYTTQGAGCYIKSFSAFLQETDRVLITAELGTLYKVKQLVLEKLVEGTALPFQIIDLPSTNSFQWEDDQLLQGVNYYRLRIQLESGQIIYSEPAKILVVKQGNYLLWPNPVAANSGIWVHAKDFAEAILQLYNAQGHLVKQQALIHFPQWLPVAGLKSGLYFLVIRKDDRQVGRSSVLVK